ncbi:LamG-like jellyroll fold domain-containing protein [Haliscomenobacter sp.]|uniref:LamG-like jellyroll fold domain-containing protein n=1 Tax=Haliscomenobacter sp. TaxID=2717303 RepID=UPI003593629E
MRPQLLLLLCLPLWLGGQTAPIGYYPFEGTAEDKSSLRNDAQIFGNPRCVPGIKGSAYQLDGNDYFEIPNVSDINNLTSEFTFACWVFPTATSGNTVSIITKSNSNSLNTPFNLAYQGGSLIPYVRYTQPGLFANPTQVFVNQAPFAVKLNEWNFVVWRFNRGKLDIFLNGNLLASITLPFTAVRQNNAPVVVGHDEPGAEEFFIGIIDELYIYNKAVSDQELLDLYNSYTLPEKIAKPVSICDGEVYRKRSIAGFYADTIRTARGCDSVSYFQLTVNPSPRYTVDTAICNGQSAFGYTYTNTYFDTFQTRLGCDSIRTLNLQVLPHSASNILRGICTGQSFEGYTKAGTYVDVLKNAVGCDSVRTIQLLVFKPDTTTIERRICAGETFLGYTATGVYRDTFRNFRGCDSLRIVRLTVFRPDTTQELAQICAGKSLAGHSSSGTYTNRYQGGDGCDSVHILQLTVLPPASSQLLQSICSGETFERYTRSGIYRDTFQTPAGCDSIRVLQLAVLPPTIRSISASICPGERVEGYDRPGTYVDTLVSSTGCDSVRTLTLSATDAKRFILDKRICAGESFLGYTAAGTYLDTLRAGGTGCDSIRTLNLIVNTIAENTREVSICAGGNVEGYTQSGTYTKTVQRPGLCDSIYTLKLNVGAVFVPNAFSPNGDRINDSFKIMAAEGSQLSVLRFFIRDRYGSLVFQGTDLTSEWDGTIRGQKANIGVYYYAIELECGGKRSVLNGGVHLIR